ncbi:MAG: hypothetical protein WA919_12820 [Coleofasciculaceae cyanobacterium]
MMITEQFEPINLPTECPKCGKHSLIRRSNDQYHCLWCGFYRNLSQPEAGNIFLVAAALALVFVVLLANYATSSTSLKQEKIEQINNPIKCQRC